MYDSILAKSAQKIRLNKNMKKNKPIIIAILIPLISLMIAGVFVYMGKSKKSAENDSNALPFERYMENPTSFAGNCYEISASVDSQLAYVDNKGRIILLKTFAGKSLPIFVPATITGFNPNVGQRYTFQTKIDQNGKLILTDFRKQ